AGYQEGESDPGKQDSRDRFARKISAVTAREGKGIPGSSKAISIARKAVNARKAENAQKEATQVKLEMAARDATEKRKVTIHVPRVIQGEMEVLIKKKVKKDDWTGEDVAARLITLLMRTADQETYDHSRRVVNLSALLAQELGLVEPGQIQTLKDSALLHDIGSIEIILARISNSKKQEISDFIESVDLAKAASLHDIGLVKIPRHILTKKEPLTPAEEDLMKQHPIIGEEIVKPIPSLRHIAPIIRHHHEQWDGKGYPDGISGEKIPFEARIIAVADAYDSMVSGRANIKGLLPEEARAELVKGAGKQFDPKIVSAFLSVLDNLEK
ncbi:MAG: HD domain-containing protein, partial [Candidatus Eremiobacteraeota bacterium]|nr:HD domain-containing protein [Candidatus Eremiobacteraeota bacterium]